MHTNNTAPPAPNTIAFRSKASIGSSSTSPPRQVSTILRLLQLITTACSFAVTAAVASAYTTSKTPPGRSRQRRAPPLPPLIRQRPPLQQRRRQPHLESNLRQLYSPVEVTERDRIIVEKMLRATKALQSKATLDKIAAVFPKAMPNKEVVSMARNALFRNGNKNDNNLGYRPETSLLATSLCCDEVSRPLEDDLVKEFGDNFSMGGLAGFPFGGVTGFGAMAHHIPDGGSCLIVYGPHVGVDLQGNVGTVDRRGRATGGACCGSAVAAANYVREAYKSKITANGDNDDNNANAAGVTDDPLDAQQAFVGNMLLPAAERLERAGPDNVMVELPYAMFDAQDELMDRILAQGCSAVADPGKIALLGGIQINTPDAVSDYFLPLRFDVRDNNNRVIRDLLDNNDDDDTALLEQQRAALP